MRKYDLLTKPGSPNTIVLDAKRAQIRDDLEALFSSLVELPPRFLFLNKAWKSIISNLAETTKPAQRSRDYGLALESINTYSNKTPSLHRLKATKASSDLKEEIAGRHALLHYVKHGTWPMGYAPKLINFKSHPVIAVIDDMFSHSKNLTAEEKKRLKNGSRNNAHTRSRHTCSQLHSGTTHPRRTSLISLPSMAKPYKRPGKFIAARIARQNCDDGVHIFPCEKKHRTKRSRQYVPIA